MNAELRNLWAKRQLRQRHQSFAWFYAVNTVRFHPPPDAPQGVLVSDQAGSRRDAHACRRSAGACVMLSWGADSSRAFGDRLIASGRVSTADDPAYLLLSPTPEGTCPGKRTTLKLEEETAGRLRRSRWVVAPRRHARPRPEAAVPAPWKRPCAAPADADVHPDEVDVVFCDGAAIPELDRIEAAAINAVFGEGAVPVTVPKTMTGRLFSGAVALDAAAALLSIRDGVIPPTINATAAPDLGLDLVTETPRSLPVRRPIVARGIGGFNSALVLRAAYPARPMLRAVPEGDTHVHNRVHPADLCRISPRPEPTEAQPSATTPWTRNSKNGLRLALMETGASNGPTESASLKKTSPRHSPRGRSSTSSTA